MEAERFMCVPQSGLGEQASPQVIISTFRYGLNMRLRLWRACQVQNTHVDIFCLGGGGGQSLGEVQGMLRQAKRDEPRNGYRVGHVSIAFKAFRRNSLSTLWTLGRTIRGCKSLSGLV